ncbi:hypothetical protein Taro_041043, partial [Colocasia esculenta]|nr:hypothetical protein [Colocasia esculenta]
MGHNPSSSASSRSSRRPPSQTPLSATNPILRAIAGNISGHLQVFLRRGATMSAKDCGNHGHCKRKLYGRILAGVGAFILLVLVVMLVVWLVLRPTKPKFYLQDATVYAFNRTDGVGSLLTTTIQITVSTRNPNDRVGIYYDKLDVYAAYKYQQITLATSIPPTYQGQNDVIIWSPFLYGLSVPIAPYLSMSLGQDQSAGILLLYVKIVGRLRWKVGSWTSGRYRILVNCPALLSFSGRGVGPGGAYSPVIRFQQIATCSVDQPLPGSYYGPAVPPQRPAKARDCCCCLLSTAVKILIGGIILLGVLAIVLWLLLRPYDIKAHVTSASLSQFTLVTLPNGGRNLQYNLSTVVTLRNRNRRVGIYYDYLESSAEYEGKRFAWRTLPTFYQGHKNTTTVSPAFAGASVIDLSNSDVSDFEMQRQAGMFDVTLRLWGRIRYKIGSSYKTGRSTLRIRCNLQIPSVASGRNFTETRCR